MIFWNFKKKYSDFIHTLWKSCTQYCFWVPSFVAIHITEAPDAKQVIQFVNIFLHLYFQKK